jgi:hypothetical protein
VAEGRRSDIMQTIFDALSILSGLAAACLWYRASIIKLPSPSEDSYKGGGPFTDALKRQSVKNAHVALATGVAVFFQALSIGANVVNN